MKYRLSIALALALAFPLFAQNNEATHIENAGQATEQIVNAPEKIPQDALDQANCVVIVLSVVKFTVSPAGSYASGVITCRSGIGFNGPWGSPAMVALQSTTAESQLSGNAIDFALLLFSPRAVDKLLKDRVKLGADASVGAGPVAGATSKKTDITVRTDILPYWRASGKLAGISLEGSTLGPDNGANKNLYGQGITAETIVFGKSVSVPDSARNLLATLQKVSPAKKLKAVPK
jgi:lipid-binding SYLF domain-containing protein